MKKEFFRTSLAFKHSTIFFIAVCIFVKIALHYSAISPNGALAAFWGLAVATPLFIISLAIKADIEELNRDYYRPVRKRKATRRRVATR